MDSGATEHLTPYGSDFKSYVALTGSESQQVTLGDGKTKLRVRADLDGHLKYSRRWSGVRAGVLLGAQGAVHRGGNRGGL